MTNVLQFVPSLGSGGIEQLIRQWHQYCLANGFNFVVLTFNASGSLGNYLKDHNVNVISIERIKTIGCFSFVKKFKNIILNNQIDIIHIPASQIAPLMLLAAKLAKCKRRIVHAHINKYSFDSGSLLSLIFRFLVKASINILASTRIACSNQAGKYCFGKRYVLLRNGIDIEKYRFSEEDRYIIRSQLCIDRKAFVVGLVGRLTEQKNQCFAIQIFKEIVKESSNSKLLIIGGGEDKDKLTSLVAENGLDGHVLFLGEIRGIEAYLSSMDVFLFPSLYEGLGIAAIEAQANGLKCYLSEMVPSDAILLSNVDVISLKESSKTWANRILNSDYQRIDTAQTIVRKCGYEESEMLCKLVEIYRKEVAR